MSQNHPNPWIESKVIAFDIPVGGEVELRLYYSMGKLITTITDTYTVGPNEIKIKRDNISLPGKYLYELRYKDSPIQKHIVIPNQLPVK